MKIEKVEEHLKEKLKDPYFKELYELEEQKLTIVKQIITYRIKHNLTQKQFAKKAKVTQQYISKIENGEFSNIVTLEKILLFIGYTVKIKAVPLNRKVRKSIEDIVHSRHRSSFRFV
ncbi:MAG: helix-turn-helix transcriptional regulator [Candidatus Omnitrophota bacterium]|nr:MAG: helix-turn-helix transcriptional regulator [Candidatus Omnitrophota bacterium]